MSWLWAIGTRISDFGFTPNRGAALGENVVLLVNLGGSAPAVRVRLSAHAEQLTMKWLEIVRFELGYQLRRRST